MKKIIYFLFILALILLATKFLEAQYLNIFIHFESKLFEVINNKEITQQKDNKPDILLFMKIYNSEIGKNASQQIEQLKQIFNLSEIILKDESETEISWRSKEKIHRKVTRLIELNGEEYYIFIIPYEIDVRKHIYKFKMEVYKNKNTEKPQALKSVELISQKDISWDISGPLFLRFFLNGKVYFLSFNISITAGQVIRYGELEPSKKDNTQK